MRWDAPRKEYVALASTLAIIGAGIWWRVAGEPTSAGLAIVGVAAAVVVILLAVARLNRRSG